MITIRELSDHVSDFGGVTKASQRQANHVFITGIHASLKEGGMWGWPDGQEIYCKVGDGFELSAKYADA